MHYVTIITTGKQVKYKTQNRMLHMQNKYRIANANLTASIVCHCFLVLYAPTENRWGWAQSYCYCSVHNMQRQQKTMQIFKPNQ